MQPAAIGTRPAISAAESKYTALITGIKRRLTNNFDFSATYTLAEAKSQIGTAADELNANNLQDATLLYDDPRVYGPTSRTDARHSGSLAMVYIVKGFTIAPTYFYRSPLPVQTIQGVDANLNGENNDLPLKAYQFDGIGEAPEEIGNCETWNCSRGAWRTQLNLRVSKGFGLFGSARIEAIGEVFNLFNAKNPAFTDRQQPDQRRVHAAERVCRRLPAARAARRPDRLPLLVLARNDRTCEGRGHSAAPFVLYGRFDSTRPSAMRPRPSGLGSFRLTKRSSDSRRRQGLEIVPLRRFD